MNNEAETINSTWRPTEADIMRQDESSQERQAMKRTVILAFLGIGIYIAFYCVVLQMSYSENKLERRAVEMVNTYGFASNGISDSTDATKAPIGKVTAIAYSIDKPSAVMGCRVVHEGDTIHRVKVIKIEKGKVHFEKNGSKWAQGVGDAPESHWK